MLWTLPGMEKTGISFTSLQSVSDQMPRNNMLIVMEDFNAMVGNSQASWKDVMEQYGHRHLNVRGKKLIDLCREPHYFKHRHKNKVK